MKCTKFVVGSGRPGHQQPTHVANSRRRKLHRSRTSFTQHQLDQLETGLTHHRSKTSPSNFVFTARCYV